ncbi:MAG: hypothetical protein WCW01_03950 [Gammaproteobacteria bacterium]|jgi:hypothetical protein
MIVKTGDIIHLDNYPVEHRKTKWAVVIASEMKWCFCINTNNRSIYACLPIKKIKYSFLLNDEHYIACSMAIEYNEKNITKKFGKLDLEDLKRLRNHIGSVKTLAIKYRNIIVSNIQNEIKP